MPQREVELILVRQLASYLTMPMLVTDTAGALIYLNEPAEALLGRRFDEAADLPLGEWAACLPPLVTALQEHRPAHASVRLRSLTGEEHDVDVTCFPLSGQAGRELGAVALLWKTS